MRIGYAYRPGSQRDPDCQEAALLSAGCVRVYADEVAITATLRPALDEAIDVAAGQRRCSEEQRVVLTVHALCRLARHGRELVSVATALRSAGVCLDVLTGALCGIHDPQTDDRGLFGILAVAAHLDDLYVAEKSRSAARAAAAAGARGGRPRVLDDAMLALARRLRDQGVPVPGIARQLVIPAGRNAGRHPSPATVYRALAEPEPIGSPRSAFGTEGGEPGDDMDEPSGTRAGRSRN